MSNPAPNTDALRAHLLSLSGLPRVDALNEAASQLSHDHPLAVQLASEAHTLAVELGDELRAAQSLVTLGLLLAPSAPALPADRSPHALMQGALAHLGEARREQDALARQLHAQTLTLAHAAQHDALTGLRSRRTFQETLALEFARVRRQNYPLTVALFDLDDFRRVNKTFSHAVGDDVLRHVAQLLSEGCRKTDVLARYGGEEFALLLHGTTGDAAVSMCERLRDTVARFDWSLVRPGLRVTLSVGVCANLTLGSAERLLACAEEKLAKAKRSGGNLVHR